ncbi:thioester reductase domain-containing protein [Synechococcus sp. AH-736-G20]|nr:thioester reductase domain-containing protein [Synechococcus sp. AH-736-G20]
MADLVPQLQGLSLQAPRQLMLLLPCRSTAAVRALQAAVRSLALDAPAWRCSTITLAAEELTEVVWQRLLAATSSDAEVRWCGGEAIETRQFKSIDADRFQVLSDGTGRLDGLVQAPLPLTRLQPGELELAVEATGLNFRDVLNALGLLKSHNQSLGLRADARLPFGGEAVGRVVAVGPGVDLALIGQRMLAALTLGSLASHVRCRAALCVPWPGQLDPVQGASLSTAYLTAEHGLEQLAQLKAGEFVLIHAAAGGVGQAAVQVAKRCGARILATASAAKQAALLEQGVEAVFDSRSTLFTSQVLEHTAGRGVDVVLNSLKGEWVEASFRALAHGGRFVELGKLEIWSDQQVQERRPDATYHRFDLLEVAAQDPQPLRQRLLRLVEAAQQQRLVTLPTTAFPVERCKEAFRQMAQGRHVGKIVITLPQQAPPCRIRPDGTYLLIGAFGSLGLRLQRWLVDQGAQSLLLLGRQLPQPGTEAAQHLNALLEQGIQAQALTWEMLPQILRALAEGLPLRGVIHAAGTLRDQRTEAIDPQSLKLVLDSKWGVADRLAALRSEAPQLWDDLDFELIFSSIAAGLGSPGQLVYGAANGAVEGACLNGSAIAPVRLAIQWGPWAGSGMAAGLERRFEAVGLKPLQDEEALNALERLLQRGRGGVVTVMAADWPRLARQALPRQASWFQSLLPEASGRTEEQMRAQLQALPKAQRRFWLITTLRDLLAEVMEEPADQLDSHTNLFDLGLDSLMAAEFAAVVQETLGWRLDLAALSDAPCLDDLAALALERLLPQGSVPDHRGLDLQLESQLPEGWALPELAAQTAPGETVLLTGASGFLGAYLLAGQLRRWPGLRLRCLVRAASVEQGQERLEQNLRRYGLWQPGWASRLEVVLGDLSQPQLGLDPEQFKAVGLGLGGILHNGAQLSQMASYGQLAAANVGGTRTMLQLATAERPLRFELISSVAVFEANALRDQPIDEQTPLEAWQGIQLGYSQTKWVADRMVRRAAEAGLPVTVYRPPLIAGASCGSTWHEGDLLQRLLMGALAVGASPDLPWELDVVPVDYVADAVTALAWGENTHGKTFHLQHPEPMLLTTLLSQIAEATGDWRVLPMQDWLAQLEQDPGNPLQPMLPFFQRSLGSDGLTYPERNCVGQRARPCCVQTTDELLKHGVRCPPWDELIGPWSSVLLSLASKAS